MQMPIECRYLFDSIYCSLDSSPCVRTWRTAIGDCQGSYPGPTQVLGLKHYEMVPDQETSSLCRCKKEEA